MWRILFLLSTLLLGGCGGAPANPVPPPEPVERPQDVVWAWAPNGITVHLLASDELNMKDGQPHAISLCIYQMQTLDALTARAATREGLVELLQCRADPAESVKATHRYVQPGEEAHFSIDRAENARFIAVVAGYDHLNPQASFRTVAIPMHGEPHRRWYLQSYTTYSPGLLDATIHLDAEQVDLKGVERVF